MLSALGIPLAAAATAGSPAPDSFTLVGSALAVFCVVAYMRMKQNSVGVWSLIFNALATGAVGWMAPEPLAHYAMHIDDMSNKTWTGLAFLCGLGGGAVVTSALVLLNRRVPKLAELAADKLHLPKDTDNAAPEGADVKQCRENHNNIKWCRSEPRP